MIELVRALGALVGPPAPALQRVADALELGPLPDPSDHADLFLFQLPPFASIYLGAEGQLGGEARDRVAGFWRAVGIRPPAEPDELGTLLGLYAHLLEATTNEPDPPTATLIRQGTAALFHEHLSPWLGAYASCATAVGPPFYRRWATLLMDVLGKEAGRHAAPRVLPLHAREAPTLPDPRQAGGSPFLDGLLAPIRSGMILTRTDLAEGAHALGLAVRAGERRYALEALLSQDAGAVLDWLEGRARVWIRRHAGSTAVTGPALASFWADRASGCASLLADLARSAWEAQPCAP